MSPVSTTRGTPLLETLRAWFSSEANASATADLLSMHVDTVYQCLDRLDSVLVPGWRNGDRDLELRLWDLMVE